MTFDEAVVVMKEQRQNAVNMVLMIRTNPETTQIPKQLLASSLESAENIVKAYDLLLKHLTHPH